MCSFLLLFLILIVGFDLLQNSIAEFHPETAIAPSTCSGQIYVALALQTGDSSWPIGFTTPLQDICWSSFQRPIIFEEDTYRDQEAAQNHGRPLSLALHTLSTHQQESGRKVRVVPGTLDHRCPSQHGAQNTSGDGIQRCMAATRTSICLGEMGRLGQLAGPYQSITEPLQEPTGSPKIAESKEPQRQRQRCWEEQGQAQGCSPVGDGCRSTAQCELQQLAICTPCGNIASVAFSGWGCAESDANHSIGVK